MKNIFLLFILSILTITACKKKETPSTRYISAKIGTANFYTSGTLVTRQRNPTNPNLQFEGVMSTGATMKFWVNGFTDQLLTFPIDGISSGASYLGPTPSIELQAVHGNLVFLTVTPDITGTFEFTCSDSSVVVGEFNIAP